MEISAFRISETLQLKPIAVDEIAETVALGDCRIWIDLQEAEPAELESWLDRLAITGLARRLCLDARYRHGFYPLNNEIFLVIPVLDTGGEGQDYVSFLCTEKLLLTLHRKNLFNSEYVADLLQAEGWLPANSIAGLVSAIMIDLSLACLWRTDDVRRSVVELEQRMDRDPGSVAVDEISETRSDLLTLGAAVSDQLPAIKGLGLTEKPFFRLDDARQYLDCALANLQAADGSLNWLDRRIGTLRSEFDMHAQARTNRRLDTLTIFAAIFNPLTLMAGVWGMNFVNMPELNIPYGYPLALGLMAVVGAGMYRFFRRGGWLG